MDHVQHRKASQRSNCHIRRHKNPEQKRTLTLFSRGHLTFLERDVEVEVPTAPRSSLRALPGSREKTLRKVVKAHRHHLEIRVEVGLSADVLDLATTIGGHRAISSVRGPDSAETEGGIATDI